MTEFEGSRRMKKARDVMTEAVVSVPLPWMAVLIANDRPPRRSDEPRRFDEPQRIPLFPRAEHPALEPPRRQEPRPGSPPEPDGSG